MVAVAIVLMVVGLTVLGWSVRWGHGAYEQPGWNFNSIKMLVWGAGVGLILIYAGYLVASR